MDHFCTSEIHHVILWPLAQDRLRSNTAGKLISQQDKCPVYRQHQMKFWSGVGMLLLMLGLTWVANIIAVVWHGMGKCWEETFCYFVYSTIDCCVYLSLSKTHPCNVSYSKSYLSTYKIPISVALMSLFPKTRLIKNL